MQYTVETIYQQEDIQGFLNAFLSTKRGVGPLRQVLRVLSAVLAVCLWAVAGLMVVAQLLVGDLRLFVAGLPMALAIGLLGFWVFRQGSQGFRSRFVWRAYTNKGQLQIYQFGENGYSLTQPNCVSQMDYQGLVRICEDAKCYYPFTSPQVAHILPKRDFAPGEAQSFGPFLTQLTGLPMVQIKY